MSEPIYLDHHATTPCDPRVLERMLPFFTEIFGNPSAITHQHGRRAATAVVEARASVADFFRVKPAAVYFTAGATESNHLAIRGLALEGKHLITSAIEHPSVLAPIRNLERSGVAVTVLPVDREGFVDPDSVRGAIRAETALVSIMAANGEVGTIQPIQKIGEICRDREVPFHTDATQAAGKIPLDLSEIPCDLLSLSAHKVYGPKGVGALIVRPGLRLAPWLTGGGQEKGVRSGTVNVPGVVGLAAALEIRRSEMAGEAERLTGMRDRLRDAILERIPGTWLNGPRRLRLPGNLNIGFEGIDAESLMFAMRRFSLSSGSACSAGEKNPSPVLLALGSSEARAMESIRFGLGRSTSPADMELLIADLESSVARLRPMARN